MKVFLFLVSAIAVTSLTCKATGFPANGCDGCQWDIASDACMATRAKDLNADCEAYINCQIKASRVAGSTTCPDMSDASRFCSADVTGADYHCSEWAKLGYCLPHSVLRPKGNAAWMVPNCKHSCCSACQFDSNNCPTNKAQCANDYEKDETNAGKCNAWMKRGECEKNPVWMHRHCSASCCKFCETKGPSSAPRVFSQPQYYPQYYPQYPQYGFSPYSNYAQTAVYGASSLYGR
jgi:hypothetical protein